MKFTLSSASNKYPTGYGKDHKLTITINTIEELLTHAKKEVHPIIISEDGDGGWDLETYDDYRE